MKLSYIFALTVAQLLASASVVEIRQSANPSQIDCVEAQKYIGVYNGFSQACVNLVADCLNKVQDTTYIWSKTSCVAAATCDGTNNVYTLAKCKNAALASPTNVPSLSYNVYTNIVGSCASQPGGCPITFQNYVDWFYGALSAVNSTQWPNLETDVRNNWWAHILDWTNTGDSLPYTNFNDWLHYSNSNGPL